MILDSLWSKGREIYNEGRFVSAVALYSETTWAVGIAQLTHHEVQGGGKNPETGVRGIFAPTANRVVS